MDIDRKTFKFPPTSKLETREDALLIIDITAASVALFLVISLLSVLIFVHHFTIFTAMVLAVYEMILASLWKFHSRIAAIILLTLLTYSLIYSVGHYPQAALMIAGIVGPFVWFAIRAVEATFKLHGRFAEAGQN